VSARAREGAEQARHPGAAPASRDMRCTFFFGLDAWQIGAVTVSTSASMQPKAAGTASPRTAGG